jgi:cation diffusion facilitator CzcD-associated flavoprotein CzcO
MNRVRRHQWRRYCTDLGARKSRRVHRAVARLDYRRAASRWPLRGTRRTAQRATLASSVA